MSRETASAAIAATNRELFAKIEKTEDPDERRQALLISYGRHAETHAETFHDDLLIAPGTKGHQSVDDLSIHAHVVVGELIDLFLQNNKQLGLDFPEFKFATEQIVGKVFFRRLNELLSSTPPQGSA